MTESISRKFSRLGLGVSETGTLTVNSATATKWATARTLTLGGDLSGNVSIDGSENVTLTATVSGNTVALGTDTTGDYVATVSAGTGITTTGTGEGAAVTISIDNTVATLTGSQTLTNKTISGSNNTITNIGNGSLTNSSVTVNGTSIALGASGTLVTDDIAEDASPVNLWFTNARARGAVSASDAGGDGSFTYDSGTGVFTYTGPSATEVRAHLSAGTGLTFTTGQFAIDNTVVTLTGSQTLTNKTLTSPIISSINNTGTLTLPTSTDTLVGRATTDTLTNKTISGADNTISNIGNSSLTNSSITINGTATSLGGTRTLVTDDIAEDGTPVNLWYTDGRARAAISVTDAGGDGSLSYSSGVITYTGPSASEVRAHFTAGTGVSITSGQVAIGQAVGTSDNVTFAGVTADNIRVGVTGVNEIDTSSGNLTLDSAGGTTTVDDNATITGNLQIDGNLTVSGTTVTINATNLAVEDNMIYLNNGSAVTNPDLGIAGNYNDGTYRHAGLFRDATDGVWKFFHQYTPEPDASAYIDTAHASFALANVQAASFTGSLTGNASTASALATARNISLTGDVTGSASFDGSAAVSITATIAADSVALGTDTTGNYVASITNGNYITGGNGGSEGAALTLAVDATSSNTASKVVARDSSGNFSAGTITATLSGNASTVTNGVYTTDTGTVTNTMLAGSIANNKLANSTISGVALGSNLATLTMGVSGTGLSGSQTYNGSGAATFTVTSNATSANTASTIVARDASGNFTADTIYFTDTTNGIYKADGRFTVRSESTNNVANFASYGLYLPQTGQTAGLYVESPIEARAGLRIGSGAGSGTITVGADTANTANRLVQRDGSGDVFVRYGFASYFNMSHGVSGATNDTVFYSSYDDYIRKNNATGFRASLNVPTRTGGDASGTWGIRITGFANQGSQRLYSTDAAYNYDSGAPYFGYLTYDGSRWLFQVSPATPAAVRVAYADAAGSADQIDGRGFVNTGSNSGTNANTIASNGISYVTGSIALFGQTDGALFSQAYNDDWQHQIFGDYRTGQIAIRGKQSGTFQSWRTVLDSTNYSSYALPLSGGTVTGLTNFTAAESVTLNGIRGRFSAGSDANGIHLFSNVVIGDPTGWGNGLNVTPSRGLATWGGINVAYGNSAGSTFNGAVTISGNLGLGASPDVRLSINGDSHTSGYIYMGGTAGSVGGWGSRHLTSSGDHTINARSFTFNNVGYGSTWSVALANGNVRQGSDLARPLVNWSAGGTSTGMVIFSFPGNSGNYGMVHCVFDIYEYSGNHVATVIVGGHNWGGSWYNIGANVIGQTDKAVRVGFKDGKYCVVFGTSGSSWSYGTIVMRKIHNGGFYAGNMDMAGAFTAAQTTTESFSYVSGDLRELRTPSTFTAAGAINGYDIYTTGGWFRNHTNNNGIYWSSTGWHLYPASSSDFFVRSGANGGTLRFTESGGTTYGYLHWAADRAMGFLTDAGNWRLRVDNNRNLGYLQDISAEGSLYLNNGSPTIYLQDNNNRSSMIHCNSNIFYILRGSGTNSTGWSTFNGYWPLEINLENNDATFGRHLSTVGDVTASGAVYSSNWFRSYGATGWYNQTYGAGIWMSDGSWVRVYGTVGFYATDQIAAVGNITAYYSDERLKTKTGSISDALSKVMGLNGFFYVENDVAKAVGYKNDKQQVGVSAQEVQAILPEAVSLAPFDMHTEEDGTIVSKSGETYLTVDYSRLVPLLIEAIKEQQRKINELEKRINNS